MVIINSYSPQKTNTNKTVYPSRKIACTHAHTHTHTRARAHTRMHACTHTHTQSRTRVHTHARTRVCVHTHTHANKQQLQQKGSRICALLNWAKVSLSLGRLLEENATTERLSLHSVLGNAIYTPVD